MASESATATATINGGDHEHNNGCSYQDTSVYDNEGNIFPDILDVTVDNTLQVLDMGAIKKNSYNRTRAAMAVSEFNRQSIMSRAYLRRHLYL